MQGFRKSLCLNPHWTSGEYFLLGGRGALLGPTLGVMGQQLGQTLPFVLHQRKLEPPLLGKLKSLFRPMERLEFPNVIWNFRTMNLVATSLPGPITGQ